MSRAAALVAALVLALLAGAARAEPPTVTGVDLVAPGQEPDPRARAAVEGLAGRPLSRDAVRASIERLWALGALSSVAVDEVAAPGGIRLVYRLAYRPVIRSIRWEGDPGLDLAEVASAAGLAVGDDASEERLERARAALLARYRREGYLGARVELRAIGDGPGPGRDVTVDLHGGERARLGAVTVNGDPGVSDRQLARWLGFESGDRYRDALVRDGTRAAEDGLRREGYYLARVTAGPPDWHPDTGRVDVTVRVATGPRYTVEFDGRSDVPEAALRERLTFAGSGTVDPFEQEASARAIESLYAERGHPFARVEPLAASEPDAEPGPRTIRFHIDEGPAVKVASVAFTGNLTVSSKRLAEAIETRPPGFLVPGWFRRDTLDRDVRALVTFLRAQGFPDAAAGPPEVTFTDGRTRARIVIPVTEGPRVLVGSVRVAGNAIASEREVRSAIGVKAGDPWDERRAEDGLHAIEVLYAGRGYHGAVARLASTRREDRVDLDYEVREGEPTRIGRVLVQGLVLTREGIVRGALPFRAGDLLLPDKLTEGQRRLGELPAFASVSVDPLRPPPTPYADVEVTVREREPWHLDFGGGYGNRDGVRAFLELGHDNVLGTGSTLSFRQRMSGGGQTSGLAERSDLLGHVPWILGSPWSGDVDVFQAWSAELGYDLFHYGVWLGVRRDLLPERITGLRGDLRYRFEVQRYSNVDAALAEADVTAGTQIVSSVTPVLSLDRRDDRLDPRRGSLHLLSLETATTALGGNVSFLKARIETAWFFDWLSPTVLVLAGRLGLATTLGDTQALPIQDRFFAGGASTVRGFREDRLGPRDSRGNPAGGNGLAIANVEWRFPIWRFLGGTLFVDTGAVTPQVSDLSLDALRTGAGAGLRVKTPVGPVRVDVGYALQSNAGDARLQVYVSVGNPF